MLLLLLVLVLLWTQRLEVLLVGFVLWALRIVLEQWHVSSRWLAHRLLPIQLTLIRAKQGRRSRALWHVSGRWLTHRLPPIRLALVRAKQGRRR